MTIYFLGNYYNFKDTNGEDENSVIARADKEGEIRRDENGNKYLWVRGIGKAYPTTEVVKK